MTGADRRSSDPAAAPSRVRIIGGGRAGRSLAGALEAAGWEVVGVLGRGDDPRLAAADTDLVVIATPDAAIAEVAAAIEPRAGAVVAHLSGASGQRVFEGLGHTRTAVLHPLVAMPDPVTGARRLAAGAWFAVAGDPLITRAVDDLGGRWFEVAEADWVAHHAAAVIASNHVVAVLGQAERVAASAGVPFAVYLELVRATLDNVIELGPAAALTGPAARGDEATVAAHLAALDPAEREGYAAVADLARRLAASRTQPDVEPG